MAKVFSTCNVVLRFLLACILAISLSPLAFPECALAEAVRGDSEGALQADDEQQPADSEAASGSESTGFLDSDVDQPDPNSRIEDALEAEDDEPAVSDEDCLESDAEAAKALALESLAQGAIPAFTMSFATEASTPVVLAPQSIGGMAYFFVPAGASLSNVSLSFVENQGEALCLQDPKASSWEELTAGTPFDLTSFLSTASGSEFAFTVGLLSEGVPVKTATYRLMQSDNLASVFLTSADPVNQGRQYIEGSYTHSTKAAGSVRVLSGDSSERFSGDFSAIKGRGNTSWTAASKKSYQVKLNQKADLLDPISHKGGAEKSKKWLLIGNPFDPTSMRNELTYQLAKDIGMPAAIDAESVDLYYDGEYRGMYLLTEKVEIGAGRVNIHDLEADIEAANPGVDLDSLRTVSAITSYGAPMQYVAGMREPSNSTGGYLLELDDAFYSKEKSWFATQSGKHFVSKSPEYLSQSQVTFISNLVSEAMVCLENGGVHPSTGKGLFDYFDRESLAKYFIVQEFCKNADAYISSTFFYVPQGQRKLYAGPVWDCDGTYGIRNELSAFRSPKDWLARNGFHVLTTCDAFVNAMRTYYAASGRNAIMNLAYGDAKSIGSISYYATRNQASKAMNAKIWGLAQSIPLTVSYANYDASLGALRNWAQQRASWFDLMLGDNSQAMYRLYNPYSGEHFYTASGSERNGLVEVGWKYEGIGWWAPRMSSTPVYRLYSGTDHHYTTNASERDHLISVGWRYEGIGWYSDDQKRTPLYRQFNPYVQPWAARNNSGSHNYTTNYSEHAYLCSIGWIGEGVGWYGIK